MASVLTAFYEVATIDGLVKSKIIGFISYKFNLLVL